jgi:MFS family permease
MTLGKFNDLHPTTRRLILARGLRSVGQGALVVDFALYLHALHWSGIAIGLLLGSVGIFGAALSLLIGMISDRLRRKPFLLIYEGIALLSSVVALLTAQPLLLAGVAIAGGFGRGANGAAGPFSPAEQAWLAEQVLPARRGWVYSLNTAFGFFGMGLGAAVAMLPAFWTVWLSGALAYRPLFALVSLASIGNLILLAQAHEDYHGPKPIDSVEKQKRAAEIRHQENQTLTKLVLINVFNGVAIGLTGPLMSYWFALRFDVGPAAIAPVMAATFIVTGASSLFAGKLSEQVGIIHSVVWTRLLGLILLVLIPLMPIYWLAALLYLLRSALNRGSAGARQALAVGLVRDERRGLATSLNAVSFQLPQSLGPSIAGYLLDASEFTLPFYMAAVFQAIYLVAYQYAFRDYEPAGEHPVKPLVVSQHSGEREGMPDGEKLERPQP